MEVLSLYWEDLYLNVIFNEKIEDKLFITDGVNKYEIYSDYINDNKLRMPITCVHDDSFLDEGNFNFLYKDKIVSISINEAKTLANKDKTFFYKNNKFCYIMSFIIDEEFNLIIKSNYMVKNNKPKKNAYGGKKKIVGAFFKLLSLIANLEYRFFLLFRCKKNNILFMSETRSSMQGNLLALYNRLNERGLDKDFNYGYSFKTVLSSKKTLFYYANVIRKIAKANYVFIDDYSPTFNFLNLKNTKLIQLWHAGVGFKSVGYARFGKDGSPHPFYSPHKKYDYAVVAADNLIPVYQEVFGLSKKHFLAPGMLRLDGFLNKDRIKKITSELNEKYPIIKDKKVILFAPTYRGTGQAVAYYDNDKIDLEKLYEVCKKNCYVVLFKYHPFIKNVIEIDDKYNDVFKNVTDYPDINELFYVTDILITDYSSNIYEYSLFERPIIFFDYDMDEYALLRGVHNDLNNSPGNICKTFDDVLTLLENKNFDIEKVKEFRKKNISYTDDKSCDRLIKILFNK